MAAADSGSGAGGEIAGRTSSWCALWAAEGAEGREGEEGREGAEEGAEEGAARRAIEAAVERAAWLTGLSPAHAEECQVVTPPEPDSHPTPSSRPHPRASLHPPCTHPPPPRAPGGALHARPGVPRPRRLLLLCGHARPRAHGRAAMSKPRGTEGRQGPPRAHRGPPREHCTCFTSARGWPGWHLGSASLGPSGWPVGPRWSCPLHRACLPHRRGGQPRRVGARLPRLRGGGGRDAVHLPRAARDAHPMCRAALAQLRPEGRARPAHAALRPPRACWREVGHEHLVSPAATHAVASGGRATAGPMDGPATHADDALSRGHRVNIIT